jgi:hypothetical protein
MPGMADLDRTSVMTALDSDKQLRVFVRDGMIASLPAKASRRRLLLDEIAQAFEPGIRYAERDVDAFLSSIHHDHAALRRYLVDEDLLDRADGRYWRVGGTVHS